MEPFSASLNLAAHLRVAGSLVEGQLAKVFFALFFILYNSSRSG